jgi:hypothetical protein
MRHACVIPANPQSPRRRTATAAASSRALPERETAEGDRQGAAASEGTIGTEQIATRPILRPGEIFEAIPGLVISQHSGEGKANQYYLRGFQLDHGTDLESTIGGHPDQHGQPRARPGLLRHQLADARTRELRRVQEGHVLRRSGRFLDGRRRTISTSATRSIRSRSSASATTATIVSSRPGSPRSAAATLLYGVEIYHDNGTLVKPDEYHKLNGVACATRSTRATTNFAVNAFAYDGAFNSSDQIPQRLVDAGLLSPIGTSTRPTAGTRTATRSRRSGNTGPERANEIQRVRRRLFPRPLFGLSPTTCTTRTTITTKRRTRSRVTRPSRTCTPNAPGAQRAPNYSSYCPAYTAPLGPRRIRSRRSRTTFSAATSANSRTSASSPGSTSRDRS